MSYSSLENNGQKNAGDDPGPLTCLFIFMLMNYCWGLLVVSFIDGFRQWYSWYIIIDRLVLGEMTLLKD